MPNVDVQYTISLNDLMSPKIAVINNGLMQINNTLNIIQNNFNSLKGPVIQKNLTSAGVAAGVALGNAAWDILKKGVSVSISMIKDTIQTAADYQKNMLRISNLSKDGYGSSNKDFAIKEALKYALPIEEVMSGYGRFLGFTKNAPQSNEKLNGLMDNILLASKVYGVKQAELMPVMKDVGKMFSEGIIDTRVLRQLERTGLGAITPFIASQLHMSNTEMSRMMSSGKFTKAGFDPESLIGAFQAFGDTLRSKLPATLKTFDSMLTNVDNWWYMIKAKIGETSGFKKFFDSMSNLFTSNSADKIIKFGGDVFDALSKWMDKLVDFVNSGGLDRVISVTDSIVSNLGVILETIIGLKILSAGLKTASYVATIAGSAGGAAVGGAAAGIVAETIAVIPTILGAGAVIAALVVAGKIIYDKIKETTPDNKTQGRGDLDNLQFQQLSTAMAENRIGKLGVIENILGEFGEKLDDKQTKVLSDNYAAQVKLLNTKTGGTESTDLEETMYNLYKALLQKGTPLDQIGEAVKSLAHWSYETVQGNKKKSGTSGSPLKTEESKVSGSRPITINIDIENMVKDMFRDANVDTSDMSATGNKVKEAIIMAMAEAINVAEGFASMS